MNCSKLEVVEIIINDLMFLVNNLKELACEDLKNILFKYKISDQDREVLLSLINELTEHQQIDGFNHIDYINQSETYKELYRQICKYKINKMDLEKIVRLLEYASSSSYKIGYYKAMPIKIKYKMKKE